MVKRIRSEIAAETLKISETGFYHSIFGNKVNGKFSQSARKLIWIANQNDHQILIFGAWGCGVFQNDPNEIACTFARLLDGEFRGCFERVFFAVYDTSACKRVYRAFAKSF